MTLNLSREASVPSEATLTVLTLLTLRWGFIHGTQLNNTNTNRPTDKPPLAFSYARKWEKGVESVGRKSDDLIQQFSRYLLDDGKSSKTVESYTGDVRGFGRYLEGVGTPFDGTLQRPHITGYRNHLMEDGYEPSTINKKINSLQAFNRYLVARGLMPETVVNLSRDKVRIAGGSERQIEVYPEEQLERLLFFMNGKQVNARDRAIVLTLLYTGVRVSELCGIRLKNIDLTSGYMTVMGNGGKVREVPLTGFPHPNRMIFVDFLR